MDVNEASREPEYGIIYARYAEGRPILLPSSMLEDVLTRYRADNPEPRYLPEL